MCFLPDRIFLKRRNLFCAQMLPILLFQRNFLQRPNIGFFLTEPEALLRSPPKKDLKFTITPQTFLRMNRRFRLILKTFGKILLSKAEFLKIFLRKNVLSRRFLRRKRRIFAVTRFHSFFRFFVPSGKSALKKVHKKRFIPVVLTWKNWFIIIAPMKTAEQTPFI